MQKTDFNTISVPTIGSRNPAIIKTAGSVPLRVLVRNIGPVILFIAGETETLASPGGPSTGVYRLPAGDSDVFVIAPKQGLYVVASGGAGLVSVSASEALPIDFKA